MIHTYCFIQIASPKCSEYYFQSRYHLPNTLLTINIIVTSSATDQKLEIDKNLENKLEIYKNLEIKLEIYLIYNYRFEIAPFRNYSS